MVTAVVESPLRQRQRQRLRSPLAGDAGSSTVGGDVDDDSDVRHFRPAKRASGSSGGGGMRGRSAPPEIVIPTNTNGNGALHAIGGGGGGRGYTSLRDIMSSSPKDTTVSPNDDEGAHGGGGVGGGGGAVVVGIGTAVDVHMIRHPLVKHAAYAYLQLTPSAKEAEARRRMLLQRRRRCGGPICRVFIGCFEFLGAFFGCAGD